MPLPRVVRGRVATLLGRVKDTGGSLTLSMLYDFACLFQDAYNKRLSRTRVEAWLGACRDEHGNYTFDAIASLLINLGVATRLVVLPGSVGLT